MKRLLQIFNVRLIICLTVAAVMAIWVLSRFGKGVMTPEEFERGMQKNEIRSVSELEAFIKSVSIYPQWSEPGNLLSAVCSGKSKFKNSGDIYLYEATHIEQVKWMFLVTCMTDPAFNPLGLTQRHVYYYVLMDADLKIVGYRKP